MSAHYRSHVKAFCERKTNAPEERRGDECNLGREGGTGRIKRVSRVSGVAEEEIALVCFKLKLIACLNSPGVYF